MRRPKSLKKKKQKKKLLPGVHHYLTVQNKEIRKIILVVIFTVYSRIDDNLW